MQHDDRVGVGAAARAGVERLALLVGEVVGLVGADDEVVGARLVVGAVAARARRRPCRSCVQAQSGTPTRKTTISRSSSWISAEPEARRQRRFAVRGGGAEVAVRARPPRRLAARAAAPRAGRRHHPRLVGALAAAEPWAAPAGRVGRRGLRLAAVEPVVLGCSLFGHPGALRTISHETGRYRAAHDRERHRTHVVQPGEPGHPRLGDRGQPARQRPRRRHHEARRLHRRGGGPPAQRRSGGHGGDGRDDVPRAGARRRHHQDLRPGQLGGHAPRWRSASGSRRSRGATPPTSRSTSRAPTSSSSRSTSDGRPRPVPPLQTETPSDVRRQREAEIRRAHRLARKAEIDLGREGARPSPSRRVVPGCDGCDW